MNPDDMMVRLPLPETNDEEEAPPPPRRPTQRPTRRNIRAVVRRATLARMQTPFERLVAFFLLAVSYIGAILWGGGGLSALLANQVSWAGMAAALLVQVACTVVQWIYCTRVVSLWYVGALLVSAGTTTLGYLPLLRPTVYTWISSALPPESAALVSAALIFAVAVGIDVIPERMLTQE